MAENEGPFMLMVHKDFTDRAPARVLRGTFEKIWKEKGWEEYTKPKEPASSSPSPSSTPSASGGPSDK